MIYCGNQEEAGHEATHRHSNGRIHNFFSMMRIQRTIPPAAAPVDLKSIAHGFAGYFIGETYMKRLENELKEYFGVKHVFLVSSGRAALAVILNALKSLAPEKHEVLIPAYTCFSVPSAILRAGLKVVPCDIDPSTFDFDYSLLEQGIHDNTLCVLPSHLFGIPSDMDKIADLCRKRDIFIVEDAAQAMGGKYKGKLLGTLGDVGFFSMGRGKNITCGSGGIIVTDSNRIASAIEKEYRVLEKPRFYESLMEFLKVIILAFFVNPLVYWLPAGLPFLKLGETAFCRDFPIQGFSGMKAGLLRNWRRRLEESNRIRKENAGYFSELAGLKIGRDFPVPFLRLPFMTENKEIKAGIYAISSQKGLGIGKMYPTPVNEIAEIENQFQGKVFPFAKRVAERLLTAPTHGLLSEKDKGRILCQLAAISPQLSGTPHHSHGIDTTDGEAVKINVINGNK